ncbi:MAG: hypothetical protein WDW38_011155 [Sanguina aurantia]
MTEDPMPHPEMGWEANTDQHAAAANLHHSPKGQHRRLQHALATEQQQRQQQLSRDSSSSSSSSRKTMTSQHYRQQQHQRHRQQMQQMQRASNLWEADWEGTPVRGRRRMTSNSGASGEWCPDPCVQVSPLHSTPPYAAAPTAVHTLPGRPHSCVDLIMDGVHPSPFTIVRLW